MRRSTAAGRHGFLAIGIAIAIDVTGLECLILHRQVGTQRIGSGYVEQNVRFEWLVRESMSASLVRELREAEIALDSDSVKPMDADHRLDIDDAEFEPLVIVAAAVAVTYLCRAISRIVRDHRHGGIVIDARNGKDLTIREEVRGVDSGTVVVVSDDGARVLKAPDENILRELLPQS